MNFDFDFSRIKNTLLLQRKPLVMGVSLIGSSIAILAFGAYPLWGNIDTVRTNLKQEQQALAKIRQRANLVSSLSPEDMAKFGIAADALPTQKEPLATIKHLQSVAGEAGVFLAKYEINPGLISTESGQEVTTTRKAKDKKTGASTQFLDLDTEFGGTFANIRRLIVLLENSRPVLEIQTLTLDPERRAVGASNASIRYVAKIRLRSYYATFDPKTLVGSGVQPLNKDQQATLAQLTTMRTWSIGASENGGTTTVPDFNFVNSDIFGLQQSSSKSAAPLLQSNPRAIESTTPTNNKFRVPEEQVSDQTIEQIQQ